MYEKVKIRISSFSSFKFKTGNLEHPGDTMTNATVEVMTSEARRKAVRMQRKCVKQKVETC